MFRNANHKKSVRKALEMLIFANGFFLTISNKNFGGEKFTKKLALG